MQIHIEIICNSFSLSPRGHVCLEASPFFTAIPRHSPVTFANPLSFTSGHLRCLPFGKPASRVVIGCSTLNPWFSAWKLLLSGLSLAGSWGNTSAGTGFLSCVWLFPHPLMASVEHALEVRMHLPALGQMPPACYLWPWLRPGCYPKAANAFSSWVSTLPMTVPFSEPYTTLQSPPSLLRGKPFKNS